MTSQAYLDVVGSVGPLLPATYQDAIARDCPRCGALPYEACVNPATGRPARHPCLARLAAA